MADGPKRYWSEEQKEQDVVSFRKALRDFHEQLHELEESCLRDDILRDAVAVAIEGHAQQLEAVKRACERAREQATG